MERDQVEHEKKLRYRWTIPNPLPVQSAVLQFRVCSGVTDPCSLHSSSYSLDVFVVFLLAGGMAERTAEGLEKKSLAESLVAKPKNKNK